MLPAEVEGENLGARVAAELQRHQRQQHALARACRTYNQGVANIADVKGEAKWGRAFRLRKEEQRRLEMLIPFRSGPDQRERHQVRQIKRRDGRLADIGVDMSRQAAKPGLDRVDGPSPMQVKSRPWIVFSMSRSRSLGDTRILVPDGDRGGDIGLADEIGAEFLQRGVRVERLVRGIAVHQHRRLVGHHLLEDRYDQLALGEPLATDLAEQLGRVGLVPCRSRALTSGRERRAG